MLIPSRMLWSHLSPPLPPPPPKPHPLPPLVISVVNLVIGAGMVKQTGLGPLLVMTTLVNTVNIAK